VGREAVNKLVYIAGIVASDGYIRGREVRIASASRSYAEKLCEILRNLGYKPRVDDGKRVYLVREILPYFTQIK